VRILERPPTHNLRRSLNTGEGAYEHGEATNRPRPPIKRSKVLEHPPFLTSMLARSLDSTHASPDKRIRRPSVRKDAQPENTRVQPPQRGPYVSPREYRACSPRCVCALGLSSKVGRSKSGSRARVLRVCLTAYKQINLRSDKIRDHVIPHQIHNSDFRNGSGERFQMRVQGLGEFACGVAVDNFAHKSLVKLSTVPPDTKHPSHNLIAAILKHSYLPN
jgi:hypothetical protein